MRILHTIMAARMSMFAIARGVALTHLIRDAQVEKLGLPKVMPKRHVSAHRNVAATCDNRLHSDGNMRSIAMSKGAVLALTVAVLGHGRTLQMQELTLEQLTPTTGPPANCDLLRVQREPLIVGLTLPNATVPSNPWTGSDRDVVAGIREMVYGAPRLPDAPFMPLATLATFRLQLAEGIEEGYVAAYEEVGSPRTFVYGVRFSNGVRPPESPSVRWRNTTLAWIQVDRVAAVAYGGNGECSRAIAAHVKSLVEKQP